MEPSVMNTMAMNSLDESDQGLQLNCDSGEIRKGAAELIGSLDDEIDWDAVIVTMDSKEAPLEGDISVTPNYSQIKYLQQKASEHSSISAAHMDYFTTTADSLEYAMSRKHKREEVFTEEDDADKIMRIGSLGRIIASSNAAEFVTDEEFFHVSMTRLPPEPTVTVQSIPPAVPNLSLSAPTDTVPTTAAAAGADKPITNRKKLSANRGNTAGKASPVALGRAPLKGSEAFSKIVLSFNMGDLESLSHLVKTQCDADCELHWKSLRQIIRGRKEIMMFWALQMESFPDGVWQCMKSSAKMMTISREFKFSGTRVFRRPTNELFSFVKNQVLQYRELTKQSVDIDEISSILESCWVSPVMHGKPLPVSTKTHSNTLKSVEASSSSSFNANATELNPLVSRALPPWPESSANSFNAQIPIGLRVGATSAKPPEDLGVSLAAQNQFINGSISISTDSHASDVSCISATTNSSAASYLTHISDCAMNSLVVDVDGTASIASLAARAPKVSLKATNVLTNSIRLEAVVSLNQSMNVKLMGRALYDGPSKLLAKIVQYKLNQFRIQ